MVDWGNTTVLLTGGTGSFGQRMAARLWRMGAGRVVVYSRDELKQHEMRQRHPDGPGSPARYFIGDIRDRDRLMMALRGVDVVIHAAALKQVVASEYNPFEAIKTNVLGAQNLIEAAIERGVQKVIALSTDKAVNPVNLYGATKLCAEKLFQSGNAYAGGGVTRFSVVRYGNVVGSRGSVVPFFRAKRETGKIPITDPRMTRFWITLDEAVDLVLRALETMRGGEIYVPKIPSIRVVDLAEAIAPGCRQEIVGIRPGEKLHETLISEEEARHAVDAGDHYLILPEAWWAERGWDGEALPEGFRYSSDTNDRWLSVEELREMTEGAHALV